MLSTSLHNPPAILWDMNGVLLDDEPVHEKCFSEIFSAFCGISLTHEDYLNFFFGKTDFDGMKDFFVTVEPDVSDSTLNLMCGEKHRLYVDYFSQGLTVNENAKNVLDDLSSAGYKQALVTCDQKVDVISILENILPNVFDSVVTAQDVKLSKPYADPYVKASLEVGVDISNCVVVEDSHAGVTSAAKAGAMVVGYCEVASSKHARELKLGGSQSLVNNFSLLGEQYFEHFVDNCKVNH